MKILAVLALVVSTALTAVAQDNRQYKGKMTAARFKTNRDVIEITVRASFDVSRDSRDSPGYGAWCYVEMTDTAGKRYFGKANKIASIVGTGRYTMEYYFVIRPGSLAGAKVSAYRIELRSREGLLDEEQKGCSSLEELETRNADSASLEIESQGSDVKKF